MHSLFLWHLHSNRCDTNIQLMNFKLFNDTFLLFVLVQTVQLTCYACPPSTVWSDCFVKQESMTCAFGNDRCGSASLDIKGSTIYTKGCVSHSECGGGVDCCAGNFCNHGTPAPSTIPPVHTSVLPSSCPGPVVSAIMVLACSIVAFVR